MTYPRRIIGEGDRIAAIVASLLSFSRRESENRSLVSITELIEESLTLTGAQLRKDGIALSVNIDDMTCFRSRPGPRRSSRFSSTSSTTAVMP